MSNRIIRNLPDSKYKAVVGNTLAGGSNPFGTESEITDVIETTIEVNGLTSGIQGTSADAAYITTNGIYRLPTRAEIAELIQYCTLQWTTNGGVNGMNFNSTIIQGRYIFIPAAGGYAPSLSGVGNDIQFWSGSNSNYGYGSNYAYCMLGSNYGSPFAQVNSKSRSSGLSIRAVSETEGVDLGLPSGIKWASKNLGATYEYQYGGYYAWGELTPRNNFTANDYMCPASDFETENDPLMRVTKPITSTVLHKDNTAAHLNPVKEARWDGKQDALGFTPENVANKKTSLSENSDTYYPTQKAVKTALDSKVDGPASSVANTLPAFADETGKLLKGDTGVSVVNSEIIAGGVNINSAIAGIPTQISNALTLLDGELAFIFRES